MPQLLRLAPSRASVQSMSEAALENRVKTIERAKGKHAVAKMRLFAQVAFLEGYEHIAELATAALARLIEVLGDIQDDGVVD